MGSLDGAWLQKSKGQGQTRRNLEIAVRATYHVSHRGYSFLFVWCVVLGIQLDAAVHQDESSLGKVCCFLAKVDITVVTKLLLLFVFYFILFYLQAVGHSHVSRLMMNYEL